MANKPISSQVLEQRISTSDIIDDGPVCTLPIVTDPTGYSSSSIHAELVCREGMSHLLQNMVNRRVRVTIEVFND